MPTRKFLHVVLTLCVCALLACCAGCAAAPAASSAQPSGSSAAEAGIDVSYFEGLRSTGNVVAIDLNAAYRSKKYGQKLATGLVELMQHDGPVYIHCTAGKDRTGFVCMLLEALAGASYQQIVDDYLFTYDNYYQVNAANDAEGFNIIREQRLDSMLRHVLGAEKDTDLASADLSAGARSYLKFVGMTDGQIDQLTAYLCA